MAYTLKCMIEGVNIFDDPKDKTTTKAEKSSCPVLSTETNFDFLF